MKRLFFISLLTVLFIFGSCNFDVFNSQNGSRSLPGSSIDGSFDFARYGDVLDDGPYIRARETNPIISAELDAIMHEDFINNSDEKLLSVTASGTFTFDGGTKIFPAIDKKKGNYRKAYTLRSLGNYVEIWVAKDLKFPDNRPDPIITQEQVDYMRNDYDTKIHNQLITFFGTPKSRVGVNSTYIKNGYYPKGYYDPIDGIERTIILVDNIRCEQFYDASYPFYTSGSFSPKFLEYTDRNIINIDTKNWEVNLIPRCSTVAHELQHLIHKDNDADEDTWVNEGMSNFASFLCGYGHNWGHINYFLDHPENSLISWDEFLNAPTGPETLADYGQAYLLTLYLYDHFGKDFIRSFAIDTDNGIRSLEKLLLTVSLPTSKDDDADDDDDEDKIILNFEKVFRRFNVALAVDSYRPGDGIYEFKSIDVKVNFASALTFDKDGVPAWGSDFKVLVDPKKIHKIIFDGIDFLPIPWKIVTDPLKAGNNVFWGNQGNLAQYPFVLKADLTGKTTASLVFDHYFDIEEQWDFGMVQVSTDNGKTWVSLGNENTRSDIVTGGHPDIIASLPGFTGKISSWKEERFDLSAYTGKVIFIRFNYMTDWNTTKAGWYVDNIRIPEIGFTDSCDSFSAFISMDQIQNIPVEYAVSFVSKRLSTDKMKTLFKVLNIKPFSLSEKDTIKLAEFLTKGDTYMIVWYAAPIGKQGSVPFTYQIVNKTNDKKDD